MNSNSRKIIKKIIMEVVPIEKDIYPQALFITVILQEKDDK